MSAATPMGHDSPIDRRALLTAGVTGAAMVALAAVARTTGTAFVGDLAAVLGHGAAPAIRAATGGTSLPPAAAWEQLLGHEVGVTADSVGRTVAQVVDVRDVARPSPGVALAGEAYSVLLDAPSLPHASSVVVTIHHAALDVLPLVLLPVNGDGSWEAIVDRRVLTANH